MKQISNLLPKSKFFIVIGLFVLILPNSAFAQVSEIDISWTIENQPNNEKISSTKTAPSEEKILEALTENSAPKIIHNSFATGNTYVGSGGEISIFSEEGQKLNNIIIDQQFLDDENWLHKIKYWDRFGDSYIEVAEALLDPVGEQRYVIGGVAYDEYVGSNLEYFLLERGYDLEGELRDIPNSVFSPIKYGHARSVLEQNQATGEHGVDLRELSPNYMRLDEAAIQERMTEHLSEQASGIYGEIVASKTEQRPSSPSSQIDSGRSDIFDNLRLDRPQFESTQHVRDLLEDPSPLIPSQQLPAEDLTILVIVSVFVALAVFGYVMMKRLKIKKQVIEPITQYVESPLDYHQVTQDMVNESINLYENDKRKEAHEKLGQAIRYYYTYKLGIDSELTNFELLLKLKDAKISDYQNVKDWLLLCSGVEFAKQKSEKITFVNSVNGFVKFLK